MRIAQLPDLPSSVPQVIVPCTYNGADYKTEVVANADTLPIYSSGDSLPTYLFGYGYITDDAQEVTLIFPMEKMFMPATTISITSFLCAMRVTQGGYLANALRVDLTNKVTASYCAGTYLRIVLRNSTAFTYGVSGVSRGTVTNNTPMCGYVSVQATVD